jgi:hypothetical protein
MLRTAIANLALFIGVLTFLTPEIRGADPIAPGEKYEGELSKADKSATTWLNYVDSFYGYIADIPIKLKKGESTTISVTVDGEKRKVSVAVLDPDDVMLVASKRDVDVESTKIELKRVGATGEYKIRIVSDRGGGYTVSTSGPANRPIMGEKEIAEKIKNLKAEIQELEGLLKAIRAKKAKP